MNENLQKNVLKNLTLSKSDSKIYLEIIAIPDTINIDPIKYE